MLSTPGARAGPGVDVHCPARVAQRAVVASRVRQDRQAVLVRPRPARKPSVGGLLGDSIMARALHESWPAGRTGSGVFIGVVARGNPGRSAMPDQVMRCICGM
jgi:hypothetical protein